MILIGNVILFLLVLFIIWWFWLYKPKAFRVPEQGEIEIFVENGVYSPNSIVTKVGQPLKIHFILKDETHCAKIVVFPDFNMSAELSKLHPETVTIVPNKSGEYSFMCPMGMYRGKLIVGEAAVIDITIDGGVYTPSLISTKKGNPISLRFIRRDPSKCAEQVIFSDFDIAQTITLTEPQVITITPEKEGEYPFTCDMGMYRGKLIVE